MLENSVTGTAGNVILARNLGAQPCSHDPRSQILDLFCVFPETGDCLLVDVGVEICENRFVINGLIGKPPRVSSLEKGDSIPIGQSCLNQIGELREPCFFNFSLGGIPLAYPLHGLLAVDDGLQAF